MKVKICGMRNPGNIAEIGNLYPAYMGFVFYAPSPRDAWKTDERALQVLPRSIRKVGVFVNETEETIIRTMERYRLDAVQLHGSESPAFCRMLRRSVEVIKSFPVGAADDFSSCCQYETCCDLFLFDTRTASPGGSGIAFDWSLLEAYRGETPFLLSGGIGPEDTAKLRRILHPRLAGVDINSRFETEPGMKDFFLLEKFINELKHE